MNLFTKKSVTTFLISIAFCVSATATLSDALKIRIVNGAYSDETVVRFLPSATTGFDADYDAYKIFSVAPSVPSVYTNIDPTSHLSINALPALTGRLDMDLYAYIKADGNYTFQSIELGAFTTGSRIVLEDKQTGISYPFRNGNSMVIYLNANLVTAASRFTLHFIPSPTPSVFGGRAITLRDAAIADSDSVAVAAADDATTGVNDAVASPEKLTAYTQDGELVLSLQTAAVSNILISVYSISGQLIYHYSNNSSMGVSERLPLNTGGMYIVQTVINNNVQSQKINYTK